MKRISIVLLLLVAAVVVSWWVITNKEQNDTSNPTKHHVEIGRDVVNHESMLEATKELEQAKKTGRTDEEYSATQKLAKAIGGKAGAMFGMAASTVVPVKFYGRVVDQHGQGVSGARVDMVIGGGGYMAPGTGLTYFMTDANGYFEVKGKGQGISILDVKHPNVADVFKRSKLGKKTTGGPSLEATNQYGEKYNWHSYENKSSPLEVRVWRVEKFEKVKVGSATAFHPTPDGNLSKDSIRGGIESTCLREVKEPNIHWQDQKGSWSVTFRPIEGGIQETDDLYLNEAPVDGYQPELKVSMERGSQNYKVRIYPARHYYYYYIKDGKRIYGSLEASFDPFMRTDECLVMIKNKYNPSGSRNLAVKSH